MRTNIVAALALGLVAVPAVVGAQTTPTPFGQDPLLYTLSFTEEFDSFRTSIWNDHIWYESSNPTRNYTVEGGVLKIWPQKDKRQKFFNRTIDTDGKFYQTYGYIEVEMKLPVGRGVWSGFWIFNHDVPAHPALRPEVDVAEAYPGAGSASGWSDSNYHPIAYSTTVWRDAIDQAGTTTVRPGVDLSRGFHKYGMKWEANRQSFFYDGKLVYTLDVAMNDPMYLIFNLWFGGPAGQPDRSTPTGKTNSLEVNYVRTWRFK
jgi:beta-glucanase (GH16 family)